MGKGWLLLHSWSARDVIGAIPDMVGRGILSPLSLLPESYTATEIVVGAQRDPTEAAQASTYACSFSERFLNASLSELVDGVPSLKSFRPHPALATGFLQTIYSAQADTSDIDVVQYKRHVLLLPDGGTIAVDVSPPAWADTDNLQSTSRPTVVLNHGLTGGSHESYVRHVIPSLIEQGYRCAVVNFRGCGQTPVTSAQMYSAAKTDDLRSALLWMQQRWPSAEYVLAGFSLGANVVAKYMGEEGSTAPVKGAIVMATPFDLKMGSDELAKKALYDTVMAGNLTAKIAIAAPALCLAAKLEDPLERLLTADSWAKRHREEVKERHVRPHTLKWVDDSMTRIVGGYSAPYGPFPFATADDYYRANGSIHYMHRVARPMLCLNSDDDPIVPSSILKETREAMATNPNIALAITRGGGHLGWWTSSSHTEKGRFTRWLRQPVREWVQQVFESSVAKAADSYAQSNNPWEQGAVQKVEGVEVELLNEEELLPYEQYLSSNSQQSTPQRGSASKASAHPAVAQVPDSDTKGMLQSSPLHPAALPHDQDEHVSNAAARHAWLRTQILPEIPLLHPSRHPCFTSYKLPRDREVLQDQVMYHLTDRPNVGFLELGRESRVAGCGETFQGGKSIPGASTSVNGDKATGPRHGLREQGTVAGL